MDLLQFALLLALLVGQVAALKLLRKARKDIETLYALGRATPETTDPRDAAAAGDS